MKRTIIGVLIAVLGSLSLVSCGGDDSDGDDTGGSTEESDGGSAAADSDFDESTLPDDFPRDLIPTSYDTGSFLNLADSQSAGFESGVPVEDTIAHYQGLLGDPTLAVEGEEGQRTAQWEESGWLVSVVGSPDESLVGIARIP